MTPVIRRLLASIIAFSLIISHNEVIAKKKVCVIGAGRAGLAAIKLVADQTDKFEPVAFERNSNVGGLWIYTDRTDVDEHGLPVHSSIYKNLETIIPKEWMIYPDYPTITSTDDSRDSISHETFLEYMRNYTDHFQLRQYIQFNTLVTKVTPLKDKCTRGATRWQLEKRDLETHKNEATICDAVMVCNGQFSKPYIPEIPGMATFRGRVLHSRSYRKPEEFTDRTVVLLGAQASGLGIAKDLSPYAKKVYLSCRAQRHLTPDEFGSNVHIVTAVMKANGSEFTLQDNSKIRADVFIFCTGYAYDFPFLREDSGITYDDKHLFNLHRDFINKKYPSMALIGMGEIFLPDQYYTESKDFLESLQGKE